MLFFLCLDVWWILRLEQIQIWIVWDHIIHLLKKRAILWFHHLILRKRFWLFDLHLLLRYVIGPLLLIFHHQLLLNLLFFLFGISKQPFYVWLCVPISTFCRFIFFGVCIRDKLIFTKDWTLWSFFSFLLKPFITDLFDVEDFVSCIECFAIFLEGLSDIVVVFGRVCLMPGSVTYQSISWRFWIFFVKIISIGPIEIISFLLSLGRKLILHLFWYYWHTVWCLFSRNQWIL